MRRRSANTTGCLVTFPDTSLRGRISVVQSTSTNLRPGKIDFALACPQAKVSHDVFMLPPDKFDVQDGKLQLNQTAKPPWKQQHRLKLSQNLHGLKDAGATWFNHLRKGLIEDLKFKQSLVDPCLFCRGQVIILVICVDDCLMTPWSTLHYDPL